MGKLDTVHADKCKKDFQNAASSNDERFKEVIECLARISAENYLKTLSENEDCAYSKEKQKGNSP